MGLLRPRRGVVGAARRRRRLDARRRIMLAGGMVAFAPSLIECDPAAVTSTAYDGGASSAG